MTSVFSALFLSVCTTTVPADRLSSHTPDGRYWWKEAHEQIMSDKTVLGGHADFVLVGDSITYNWRRDSGTSWFGKVTKPLGKEVAQRRFAGYRWLNCGIGGDGTRQVIWRILHGALDGFETPIVGLMIGTNDRLDSAEDVATGIAEIIRLIRERQPKAKVLLSPIIARFPREDDPGDMNAKNARTNELIRRLCDGEKVVWLDWGSQLLKPDGTPDERFYYDREHPAGPGYEKWADALLKNLKSPSFVGAETWEGERLCAWTNDMTSIRSFRVTDEGLEARMSDWRDSCIMAKFDLPIPVGPDDVIEFRAKATCPQTGRLAPEGRVYPIYEGRKDCPTHLSTKFSWNVSGEWYDYNIRAFDGANGRKIVGLKVRLPPEGRSTGVIVFSRIRLINRPIPPNFTVMSAEADGFARVGSPVEVRVRVWNRGTSDAKKVKLNAEALPAGVVWVEPPHGAAVVQRNAAVTYRGRIRADKPMTFKLGFTLTADEVAAQRIEVPVEFAAPPKAEKASCVPEPKPMKTDYEIAACYYPGWQNLESWRRVERVAPERKPLLGWYDETNPEAIDWQIKWWVEHGISVNMLDWYWREGKVINDNWVTAFKKAKWRSYMKWCVIWCNEVQKSGVYSAEDSCAIAKYWAENYFGMPEYYRIDGKPVAAIFVPEHYLRDLGEAGTKQAIAEMRRITREAGYKDLHLLGFMRPQDEVGAENMRRLKALGFDELAIYNCTVPLYRGEHPDCHSWKWSVKFNHESWPLLARSGVPFWPLASTGWDDRPWNGGREAYGRNAADFRSLLKDLKAFADSTGRKRLMLGPFNEWGEGSYIEPNQQFGFSMYDAVRDVFCEKPPTGWPVNLVPHDVGLGPYDFPAKEPDPDMAVPMNFRDGKAHGFSPMKAFVKDFRGTCEGLAVTASGLTPGIVCNYRPTDASEYSRLKVRLKLTGPVKQGVFRLYWKTDGRQWDENSGAKVPLAGDAEWHEYVFELKDLPTWNRDLYAIRLQPSGKPPFGYVISDVRFEK